MAKVSCISKGGDSTKYYSWDRTDRPSLAFNMTTYPNTSCEKELRIEIYEMVGEVDKEGNRGKLYNPTYGFTIEVIRGKGGGFQSSGQKSMNEATVLAFARAASYGNGGFPLDWNTTYRGR